MVSIFVINDLFDALQETLKELFPSGVAVDRYSEVVLFVAGLMKDSRPLVQFLYEMQVEYYLNVMRIRGFPSIDADLFDWLHTESSVQLVDDLLHNKYINYYYHMRWRGDPDTTLVYPSRLYHFAYMEEDVSLGKYKDSTEIQECAMYIYQPKEMVAKSLLSTCRMINEHQSVTDLWMEDVDCGDATEAEAPILSRNIRSLHIRFCELPSSFMRNVLQQLHDCITLTNLTLDHTDLSDIEEDLDKLLDNLVSNHEKGLSQENLEIWMDRNGLSEEFVTKWNERCEGISSIDCRISED